MMFNDIVPALTTPDKNVRTFTGRISGDRITGTLSSGGQQTPVEARRK